MTTISRRQLVKSGAAAAASLALPRAVAGQDRIVLDDASRLNPTPVARHWIAKRSDEADVIARLRAELKDAAAAGRPVAVGAARHSMGGQSLPREGTALTLDNGRCEPDRAERVYRVQAGTRWTQVIAALDPIGFSPAVMQSNNDFGVAATFSVNAHGWAVPYGPMGSTVRSLRLMLADGSIVTCSRERESELFGLAMGGYGLFGIILDLELEMVENVLLRPRFEVMPSGAFAERFTANVTGPDLRMAYGRLAVARRDLLEQAVLVGFRLQPAPAAGLPRARSGGIVPGLTRQIYRAQIGSERAKQARWLAETVVGPKAAVTATRNRLLNEPVSNLAERGRRRTDILHEYFLPPARFDAFLAACREEIPRARQEFLNVTLRYVGADETSVLSFAPAPRIAAVMSFSQLRTAAAERDMQQLTQALIERVLALGGSFYLPYRLHARREQLEQAYPRLAHFIARKRHYDPGALFRNGLWDAYMAG